MTRFATLMIIAAATTPSPATADPNGHGRIEAVLESRQRQVNVGDPIWINFLVRNTSDEPVTLFVPGTDPQVGDDPVGLPLSHVFSGDGFAALTVRSNDAREWTIPHDYQPPGEAPVITVAPHAGVCKTLNVRDYYPALRTPGTYWLQWAPYGGAVESAPVMVRVQSLKRAEIATDYGTMRLRFFYQDTPRAIENFVELARDGFYDNLTFHNIETGYYIQGGCPKGDGTGIRPDGKKTPAELSNRPQTRGMVSMARIEDDPNSASCQFFITNTRVPEWDGKYTIFAELVGEESFATLDQLMALPADENGRPVNPVHIRTIRITEAPRQESPAQKSR